MDRRFEDDRKQRLNRTGLAAGALGGAMLGLVAGVIVPGLGGGVAALFGGMIGFATGALLGRSVVTHVDLEDMDPANHTRPFVGAQAPDEDEAEATAAPAPSIAPVHARGESPPRAGTRPRG
jgi:predicted lipid-binding transport protein (Tim44 family)